MALTMFLVRHGETLFNRRGLMQGWVDSPLTARGVEQAYRAAEQLQDRPLVAVYSSTSERAVDTAEIVATHHPGVAVQPRRGLKELHFGDSEALPHEDVWSAVDVKVFFRELMSGRGDGLAGGESAAAFLDRVGTAFAEIAAEHPDGEVCVVSHGVTIGTYLWGAGWETPGPLANASISVVTIRPESGAELVAVDLQELAGVV